MFYGWLFVFLLLLGIEAITVDLVSIWFAVGALAALFSSLFVDHLVIQVGIFVIVSFLSLLAMKPFVKKIRIRRVIPTNLDRVIDQVGIVTLAITESNRGEVCVDGKRWTAIAKENIPLDSKVKILSIEGVKLVVEPMKEV